MNASEAKQALERAVERAGGTIEEDHPWRSMRVIQLLAPEGRVWSDSGCKHVRVEIESWRDHRGALHNAREVDHALQIVGSGHRTMTEREAFECDETPN